ncbi:MAG: PH domain-containing protein [Candidatus Dormibacteraeota bacterium]|nr:PH domain-containing protein [Candidatus Dormibacteraeota bacterium]MBV9524609.1 PH domain-containing protein [Candidatus Dormibacteraeota bacterium]
MLREPRAPAEFRRVSPRFWMARQTVIALVFAPLLGGALAVMAALGGGGWVLLPAGVAALAVLQWVIELGRYRTWGYAEREDDLIVRRGLMFRRVSVVPYGRMQLIDVTAGPVDRAFGLATVQLHTAAAATDARIPGLLRADADLLRDRLAAVGEAEATGL